jgi:hypothetical protein
VASPSLWEVLSNETKKQVAARFDKDVANCDAFKVQNGAQFLGRVDGFKYVSTPSRRAVVEPLIDDLDRAIDQWAEEAKAVSELQRFATDVPSELIPRYVAALTRTYVGYKGSSSRGFSRTNFYADAAAPVIAKLFAVFDDNLAARLRRRDQRERASEGAHQGDGAAPAPSHSRQHHIELPGSPRGREEPAGVVGQ